MAINKKWDGKDCPVCSFSVEIRFAELQDGDPKKGAYVFLCAKGHKGIIFIVQE